MSKFNRCTTTHKNVDGSVSINCKLGLWSVNGTNKKQVEQEARYYFSQYLLDGEYHSIIGGESATEKLLKQFMNK